MEDVNIRPIKDDYRTLSIANGFEWPIIIDGIAGRRIIPDDSLYLVVFRSLRHPSADGDEIARHDAAAHAEAQESDALLHYFSDEVDIAGRGLSWCLWTGAAAARKALSGQAHRDAVQAALHPTNPNRPFYQSFGIELYDVLRTGNQVDIRQQLTR